MITMETFLELANRMRHGLPLQRVTREGKIDYAALQQFLTGKTDLDAMTIRMGASYIDAVENLSTPIARDDRERMLTLCSRRHLLPNRYEVRDMTGIDPSLLRSIDPLALRVAEAYSSAPPEIKRVFEDLMVATGPSRSSYQAPEEEAVLMGHQSAINRTLKGHQSAINAQSLCSHCASAGRSG